MEVLEREQLAKAMARHDHVAAEIDRASEPDANAASSHGEAGVERNPRPIIRGRRHKEPDKSGIGEVCLLRNSGKSQSSASEQQIDDKHDQQNTADTDATTISPPAIPETAAEEEYQYYNN
jgi:hypothetical protein